MSVIHSKNIHETKDFPYLVLHIENNLATPLTPGFKVMHWHEDLQYVYVISGTIHIQTLQKTYVLYPGVAAYINKSVIHKIIPNECI